MNRLVIIGNGFDLAHGLPTSYSSFLNYIWKNFSETKSNPLFQDLFEIDHIHFRGNESYNNYNEFCEDIRFSFRKDPYYFVNSANYSDKSFTLYHKRSSSKCVFSFKNKFFELITVKSVENWVDIENIYYQVLTSMVKGDSVFSQLGDINQLNAEFSQIKKLLDYYLNKEIEQKYFFKNSYEDSDSIADLFTYEYKNLGKDSKNSFFLEFAPDYRKELIDFDNLFLGVSIYHQKCFENLFVDFNYTSNVNNYVSIINSKKVRGYGLSSQIQIHGHVSDDTNPINFGFGDEMDDHYKILENTGDNKYLENIKSFMYFNNSNYRKLLNWIETKDYQVFIMGHSCGLSDRTLLNTLFEHPNCKSIKIFYHQKADGTDNFTELSQNISRHFNKKSMMRQKVVDKSLSKPLPQNVRYQSKGV
ncbi:AbiH family protein [Chryseobacterium shigense]|uniref:Bacteriophage abortive infection AbiH n=1 Tax=Chryseobacterium shigense TaxID=297244 RepID=A0A841MXF0_9FLAO|nr:AbiH family protein [Chryseobacterium shigense]MBB6369616.1 hypothetical protein [Chryseobacterium shigense]